MSTMLSRAGPSCRSRIASTASNSVRTYAAPVPKQAFRKTKGGGNPQEETRIPADARIPIFRPMPASKFKHPLLTENQAKLDYPTLPISKENVGQAAALGTPGEGPMRWFGVPKNILLEFRLLSQPCSVIRDVTVSTVELLDAAGARSSAETRRVLSGRKGCGKSFLLLQAVQHCIDNDWIVLYFPRAAKMVDSSTLHSYDLRTQTYQQPAFALRTLQRLLSTNAKTLAGLTSQKEISVDRRQVLAGTLLTEIIDIGLKEQSLAPFILDALMTELSLQTKFPVLLAIDDFQALYGKSAYKDPHFHAIHSYHLSMPRLLLEFASAQRKFARGAVLGALSSNPMFMPPLELEEALGLADPVMSTKKRSKHLQGYAKGLQRLDVPEQLSLAEATSIFDLWRTDSALSTPATDEQFLSKYTESSGNARDFVWMGLLSSLEGARPDLEVVQTPWPQLKVAN